MGEHRFEQHLKISVLCNQHRCSIDFLSRPLWLLWAITNHPNIFWRCIIHVIPSLHRDIANYTLLVWALVDIDLFLCTCCPIACTSGAPRSRAVASLGSLAAEPFHRAWHSSVSHAPHPCLWSHPPNSLLSWNLQCISSGNPGASNDAVAGSFGNQTVLRWRGRNRELCGVTAHVNKPVWGANIDWKGMWVGGRGLNAIAEAILQGIVPVKEGNFAIFHPVLAWIQRGMWTKKAQWKWFWHQNEHRTSKPLQCERWVVN